MRLKEIDIMGFKSFPDKTNIEFKDGITAIVGPNGSGKSNISDAVRWVLGEQSVKSLRGSKMEDVIFTGTSQRKPLGYCEVTIVFDNSTGDIPIDYSEVAFTRRVFRSGESEYYINKNACRLKDIRELLMDTGIGKEGYSIIGQGKIDEILSNRAEDRRNIFEEAAGIVKYKSKKEESERKLARTEENLTRVNDLVNELRKRESSLKRQADKAREYEEIYEKLKYLEINLFIHEIEENEKQLELLLSNIKKEDFKIEDGLKKQEDLTDLLSRQKGIISRLEDSIEDRKLSILNKTKEIDGEKNNISIHIESKKYTLKDLERLEEENKKFDELISGLELENKELKEDIFKLKIELEGLEKLESTESKKIASKDLDILNKEADIENRKNKLMDIYDEISESKSSLNGILSFNENLEIRIEQLYKNINDLEKEKDKIKEEFRLANEDLENLKSNLKDKFENYRRRRYSHKEELAVLEKEAEILNELKIKLETSMSNHRLYKNMEDSFDGYYKGVKSLLQASRVNKQLSENMVGLVADLIRVPEEFEVAISTALAGASQNIVTPNQESAKFIIDYLRSNKLGRVTCLPHNIIKSRTLNIAENIRNDFKLIGLASELVEYDENYRNIIENLLGRTAVVANMDDAIKLSNRFGNSIRIVTLDGGIINPGGSMTGGSQSRNASNIIIRKNTILSLEEEIDDIRKIRNDKLKNYELLNSKIEEEAEFINSLEEEIKNYEYKILNSENKRDNIEKELERLVNESSKSKGEIESLEKESSSYMENRLELENKLKNLNKELEVLRAEILTDEELLESEKKDREKSFTSLTDRKILINKNSSIIENMQDRLDSNEKSISSYKKSILRNKSLLKESQNSLEEIEKLKSESESRIGIYKKELGLLEEELLELDDKKSNESKTLDDLRKDYSLNSEELEELRESKLENQLAKNKLELKIENLNENLFSKYELDYDQGLNYRDEALIIENSREKISSYNKAIRALGNVNLNAIEEYSSLKERLDFIEDQKSDLKRAEKDLLKVIKDIEDEMEKLFIASFIEINKNFQIVFKALFNGGSAKLILEDEDDILNTGIDIEASPPGKKMQNLTSLSGGERSLVAVALLFAILQMKPAPFCILDEIDAALDEANIGRYTEYLYDISKDTQFIIITHRKRTMEIADILYGVTMEEKGVSKIVSVEMTEYEE